MKKIVLFLILLFTAALSFAVKPVTLPEVLSPRELIIDGDRLYITSRRTAVYMYSTGDFKFIKQFIEKGEGPGEANADHVKLAIYPDFLIAEDHRHKLLFLSRNGDYIKEIRTPAKLSHISLLGEHFVAMSMSIDNEAGTQYNAVNLLDKDFNIIRVLHKSKTVKLFTSENMRRKRIIRPVPDYFGCRVYNNRIYVGNTFRGFSITVYDSAGNELYEINKDYKKIKLPEYRVEKFMKGMKETPSWENIKRTIHYEFPDYFPAFKIFWVNSGNIYVVTDKLKKEKEKNNRQRELVVLDLKGKVLKKVFTPASNLCATDKNRFYYLQENQEDEVWEIHSVEIK